MASGWIYSNRIKLKTAMRVVFGMVWLIDGSLKFQPGTVAVFAQLVQQAGQGQPLWIQPWFTFWFNIVSQNPGFWAYSVGIGEIALGIGLVFGLLRKLTYIVGFFMSLMIWAVPEGLGGPYGPGSTDIGTGIIYSFVFLALMIISASYGTSKYSVDGWIEKRIRWWHALSEFGNAGIDK